MNVYILTVICAYSVQSWMRTTQHVDTHVEVFQSAARCLRNAKANEFDIQQKCTESYIVRCEEKKVLEGK
jgi:hypothetical protein